MKTKLPAVLCLAMGAAMVPAIGFSSEDADMDRGQTKSFVKDSVITTKIKSKLATEHIGSLARIHVDTDANGVVWLSGEARSQSDIDKAVAIATATDNVVSVKNDLKVNKDE